MPYDPEYAPMHIDPRTQNPVIYAAKFRIKYKDIFSLKNFYVKLHEWINSKEWHDSEGKDHYEDLYLEKVEPGDFKEIQVWWRPEKKGTDFYKFKMRVNFKALYLKQTEIMYKGKKLKVDKGEIEMKIWSFVELHGYQKWKKHPILKHFFDIYVKRIFTSELIRQKLILYRETYEMQNYMKNFLQMKLFLPIVYGEQFHATEAYPTWKK